MIKPYIHPNTPPKLVARLKRHNYTLRQLADELGVNLFYIHQLVNKGIEPTDKTENGRRIRVTLFLPRRARNHKRTAQPLPAHLKWWKRQDRQTIIKQLYELNNPKDRP